MKVWTTLKPEDLRDVAATIGVSISDRGSDTHTIPKVGRAYSFVLRPDSKRKRDEWGNLPYQRRSASVYNERRVHAVCWHGHRDFMRELFARDPEARIKTSWADYRGRESFEDTFPATAYRNVGSMAFPKYASEVCYC